MAEDRNTQDDLDEISRIAWQSPSGVAEDRNSAQAVSMWWASSWQSPSGVAEDRNLYLLVEEAAETVVAVTLRGG